MLGMCTSLRRPLQYGRTDRQMDRRADERTDKNRQTIAVTLRLRFAARVNNTIMDINHIHVIVVNVNVRIYYDIPDLL